MPELKFACPGCGQHISCDELWGGHTIQCPACKQDLRVPLPPAAAPPAATAPRPRSFVRQPPAPRPISVPAEETDATPPGAPAGKQLPVIPAVWTLDLAAAKIPEGRANGTISGASFVPEAARLDQTGQAQGLRF